MDRGWAPPNAPLERTPVHSEDHRRYRVAAAARERAKREISLGLVIVIVGVSLTAFTYRLASLNHNGGHYIIAFGPIIIGVAILFNGMRALQRAPKLPSAEQLNGGYRLTPGWYPDPAGSGGERWWDGKGWAMQTRSANGVKNLPSAGWYPDPWSGQLRWWSGHEWGPVAMEPTPSSPPSVDEEEFDVRYNVSEYSAQEIVALAQQLDEAGIEYEWEEEELIVPRRFEQRVDAIMFANERPAPPMNNLP